MMLLVGWTMMLHATLPEAQLDSLVNDAVGRSCIPGAVLCVVDGSEVVYMKAYGHRQVFPDTLPMTVNTQFDLASLSKIVGTGYSLMTLVEQGKVSLDAPIRTYLPEYQTEATIRDYLTHTSGMPAYASYKWLLKGKENASREERRQILYDHMASLKRLYTPASQATPADSSDNIYSCLNFISLQHVVERVSGMPLNEYARKYVWTPLKMKNTTYYPMWKKAKSHTLTAPTERIGDTDACYYRVVHDPLAREMMSGVSGNAGVFSTASDLAKLAIWMLNPDTKRGPLKAVTLQTMMTVPAGYYSLYGRALAWDCSSDYAGCKGSQASPSAVCHTGYTGTSMVVDPEKRLAVILLTNRAHPSDGGAVGALRRQLADLIFSTK